MFEGDVLSNLLGGLIQKRTRRLTFGITGSTIIAVCLVLVARLERRFDRHRQTCHIRQVDPALALLAFRWQPSMRPGRSGSLFAWRLVRSPGLSCGSLASGGRRSVCLVIDVLGDTPRHAGELGADGGRRRRLQAHFRLGDGCLVARRDGTFGRPRSGILGGWCGGLFLGQWRRQCLRCPRTFGREWNIAEVISETSSRG
jgi:hypothetical protein